MPVNNVNLTQSEVWAKTRQRQQIKKWYIFYTKPKAELIAEEMLVKDGFEVYLPKMNQCSIWKNRQRKTIVKPLITSYIFVYTSGHQIEKVLANPKIVAVVTCGCKKSILREADINLLHRISRHHEDITITNNYQVGDKSDSFMVHSLDLKVVSSHIRGSNDMALRYLSYNMLLLTLTWRITR